MVRQYQIPVIALPACLLFPIPFNLSCEGHLEKHVILERSHSTKASTGPLLSAGRTPRTDDPSSGHDMWWLCGWACVLRPSCHRPAAACAICRQDASCAITFRKRGYHYLVWISRLHAAVASWIAPLPPPAHLCGGSGPLPTSPHAHASREPVFAAEAIR